VLTTPPPVRPYCASYVLVWILNASTWIGDAAENRAAKILCGNRARGCRDHDRDESDAEDPWHYHPPVGATVYVRCQTGVRHVSDTCLTPHLICGVEGRGATSPADRALRRRRASPTACPPRDSPLYRSGRPNARRTARRP